MATDSPPYAALALSLTAPDWIQLGLDPTTRAPDVPDEEKIINVLVDRLTALLLIRVVAVAAARTQEEENNDTESNDAPRYTDYSTSTICRTALMQAADQPVWPAPITKKVITQIQQFVRTMIQQYSSHRDIPYHNRHHAYHVSLSTNKLIDLLWHHSSKGTNGRPKVQTKSFGLRQNQLSLAALLFSAIIHDVQHQGLPNRQLVQEDDELAILYNDQSVAEQRSLFVAFSELLKSDYVDLRQVLFGPAESSSSKTKHNKERYHQFRQKVVNLVLHTDIASPQLTQLSKSNWEEAFGNDKIIIESPPEDDMLNHVRALPLHRSHSVEIVTSTNVAQSSSATRHQSVDGSVTWEVIPDDQPRHGGRRRNGATGASDADTDNTLSPKSPPVRRLVRSNALPRGSFRQKLGIRRSMDLSGEALEAFSLLIRKKLRHAEDDDEPDELKATILMETILTAADVAHNLQGWNQMVLWSTRLYLELRKAFVAGRGGDPQHRWFENQIGFLESYLEPLAKRLGDIGVYGPIQGPQFAEIVRSNRDTWTDEGLGITNEAIAKGESTYPLNR